MDLGARSFFLFFVRALRSTQVLKPRVSSFKDVCITSRQSSVPWARLIEEVLLAPRATELFSSAGVEATSGVGTPKEAQGLAKPQLSIEVK